jgi:class 3 adenylate cyclase
MKEEQAAMKAFVLIYDIRGFSSAARRIPESIYRAFVAQAHELILSTISVVDPQFVKNIGDGNLVIWESDPHTQRDFLLRLIRACIVAQREYRALVARPSFDGSEFLPKDLGFGISWGDITHQHLLNLTLTCA